MTLVTPQLLKKVWGTWPAAFRRRSMSRVNISKTWRFEMHCFETCLFLLCVHSFDSLKITFCFFKKKCRICQNLMLLKTMIAVFISFYPYFAWICNKHCQNRNNSCWDICKHTCIIEFRWQKYYDRRKTDLRFNKHAFRNWDNLEDDLVEKLKSTSKLFQVIEKNKLLSFTYAPLIKWPSHRQWQYSRALVTTKMSITWPSGKLPFECQKIAENLTFFQKKCQKL